MSSFIILNPRIIVERVFRSLVIGGAERTKIEERKTEMSVTRVGGDRAI